MVLLGVLFRMAKLESAKLRYSSAEFAEEPRGLEDDLIAAGVHVKLSSRVGARNIMRNSGQYWKSLGLIPSHGSSGTIRLTPYGREVANHGISQSEFAAISIATLTLPNANGLSERACNAWHAHQLDIKPLLLIMSIIVELGKLGGVDVYARQPWLTPHELTAIVIPLSGEKEQPAEIARYLQAYRDNALDVGAWPNCCMEANDQRMAREFRLFLSNNGYLNQKRDQGGERFEINGDLLDEIHELLSASMIFLEKNIGQVLETIRTSNLTSEVEKKRYQVSQRRPNQAKFRADVLAACQRCIITNVTMTEVLEAAHIKPFKYKGEDTTANGFALRSDIHLLFDFGHLRISASADEWVSGRVRMDYGATIPPKIAIPDFVNKEYVQWRWDNYNGK